MIDLPDDVRQRLDDRWREKLVVLQQKYIENRPEATKAKYLEALKLYTGLVLRNETPRE